MPAAKLIAPTTKQEIPKLRVAAYCRVSSNSADQRNSFATQERVYTKYIAEKQEWELVDIFADEGLSGMKANNRPEFQRMIRMCELHQIDLILTKSVSRFARNVKEALSYTRKLKLLGVGVQFEEDGVNTLAMADEMLLNTFAAIAQEESKSISQNQRLSIVKRMELGEYIDSNAPYGYRLINKTLSVYEPEAIIVRWIYQSYLNGWSISEIAKDLSVRDVPTKCGKSTWTSTRVSYILSNERYIGDCKYQKTCREAVVPFRQSKNRGQEDMFYAKETHAPLLDKQLFYQVQELLEKKKKQHCTEIPPRQYPLTSRIRCSECGSFYHRKVRSGVIKWVCSKHAADTTACNSSYYSEERIYDGIITMINKLRFCEEDILGQTIQKLEFAAAVYKRNNRAASQLSQSIAELNAKLLALERLRSKGYLAADIYHTQAREIRQQLGIRGAASFCIQKQKPIFAKARINRMEVQRIPKRTVSVIEPQKSILVDKEKYHQKRVAAYCRVSTDSEEQLTSYQNQMRVYTEMIAANKEWEFAGLYADEGISGTRADKRPEFQRMIRDCQNGKIDYIITKSVSRFARNTVECLEYVRSLKAQGIGIFFEEQNIDTLKNESELYLVIYAGFAQSESESISKHITWTYRKKFEEGKVSFQYKSFLGYRKGEDKQPEIVPEEAAIVERIYEMFLAGQPVKMIAQTLQAEKIEIPGKNLSFSKNMIMNILRNEKYCGDCILQKTVTVDCIAKTRKANQGEAPMYIIENNHPAIISREVFNRAQEELIRRQALRAKSDKTSITATGKYSKYALTEVLQCAECGSRYRRVTWTAHGRKKIVWRCISRLDYGTKHCKDSITVEEAALHGAVVRALRRFHAEDESTYLTLMKATIGEAIGINGGSEEIDLLTRRIDTLNKRMLDLVNETVAAGKDVESSEDEFKGISDQIEQLNRRIAAIQESIHKDGSRQARLEEIQSIIAERNANETQYDDSIVRQMIECIKVHSDGKLTIIFGGGYEIEENL